MEKQLAMVRAERCEQPRANIEQETAYGISSINASPSREVLSVTYA